MGSEGGCNKEELIATRDAIEDRDLDMNVSFAFVLEGTMRDYLRIKLEIRKVLKESPNARLIHNRVGSYKLYIEKEGKLQFASQIQPQKGGSGE